MRSTKLHSNSFLVQKKNLSSGKIMLRTSAVLECALYNDPTLYDLMFPGSGSASAIDEERRARILASEKFYVQEVAAVRGRVLELACGSGRLTVPVAQTGTAIVG